MNSNYFFQNKKCEYFPCHNGVSKKDFNCFFCYCPLYVLGNKCGGNFKIISNGVKDCSECVICHGRNSHDLIESKFYRIAEIERQNRK